MNDVTVLNPDTQGVYIIGVPGRCVYVGQGRIQDRINERRNPNSESGSAHRADSRRGDTGMLMTVRDVLAEIAVLTIGAILAGIVLAVVIGTAIALP